MKSSFVLALVSFLSTTAAFAGAANADIKCASRDGMKIEGNIPGDFAEHDLTVSKAGRSIRLYSVINQSNGQTEENSRMSVVDQMGETVWTLNANEIAGDYAFLQMYALPKTVKYKSTRNGYRATFNAKVAVNAKDLGVETIYATVACSIVHEI